MFYGYRSSTIVFLLYMKSLYSFSYTRLGSVTHKSANNCQLHIGNFVVTCTLTALNDNNPVAKEKNIYKIVAI